MNITVGEETDDGGFCLYLPVQAVLSSGNSLEVLVEKDDGLNIVYQSELKEETDQ